MVKLVLHTTLRSWDHNIVHNRSYTVLRSLYSSTRTNAFDQHVNFHTNSIKGFIHKRICTSLKRSTIDT